MSHVLIPALCGFFGGIIAVVAGVLYFYRTLPRSGYVQISRGGRLEANGSGL
jgi:hypothetical protein